MKLPNISLIGYIREALGQDGASNRPILGEQKRFVTGAMETCFKPANTGKQGCNFHDGAPNRPADVLFMFS
jgi:hypothetical protein